MANPQEGVFAGASIGYYGNRELQTVLPEHRPGGPGDPYGGWKGTSDHRDLEKVTLDGEVVPYGKLVRVEAGEGEGVKVEVDGPVCALTTVEISAEELEAERERLEAEDAEFQRTHDFRPAAVR